MRIWKKRILAITFASVAMLVLSGTAQAVWVNISGLQPSYFHGNSVNFTISIDIKDPDRYVPATNISLYIRGPTNRTRVFFLNGTQIRGPPAPPSIKPVIITITPVSTPKPNESGFGIGYGCDNLTGICYNFTYGYGYGIPPANLTYIYNVSVNSTNLPPGSYNVVASLRTGKPIKPSFNSRPAAFNITPIIIKMEVTPKKINPRSRGEIKATISNDTPPGFDVASINISTVEFGPAKAKAIKNQTADKKLMLFFWTNETGIRCGDTQVNLTGKTYTELEIFGTDSIETIECAPTGEAPGGYGGMGVVTGEPFENIAKYETQERDLFANRSVVYTFVSPEIDIYQVLATGRENEYAVSIRVELLKGQSKLVKAPALGVIYAYLNVWSGSKRIEDVLIRFRVKNIWIENNNLAREDINLPIWSGDDWKPLETKEIGRDDNHTYFEAKTKGLSNFAIAGLVAPTLTPVSITPVKTPEVITPTPTPTEAPGFEIALVVLAIAAIYLLERRRRI